MFAGTPAIIGTKTYIVPPLSLGQLRRGMLEKLHEHDELLGKEKIYEAFALRGEIIVAALQRNYPDLNETEILDALDVGNSRAIWLSVLGASGFTPGEAPAVTEVVNGTSNPSIAASPPLTDGHIAT